jgi:hypothetical protein
MCVCVSARQRNNLREAVVSLAKEGMFTICVVLFFDFRESWSWLPSSLNSEWSRNFDHFEFDRFELVVSILSSLSQEHARSRSTSHNFTAPCDQNRWHPRSRPPRTISPLPVIKSLGSVSWGHRRRLNTIWSLVESRTCEITIHLSQFHRSVWSKSLASKITTTPLNFTECHCERQNALDTSCANDWFRSLENLDNFRKCWLEWSEPNRSGIEPSAVILNGFWPYVPQFISPGATLCFSGGYTLFLGL